ncbi:MAG: 2-hydroxyglutaryl-CoA dehydratase, alpha subunit [Candidatus Magnetoglobus multicellularis str. Araruama]|uniref:2-hydroxyglutaryl-CoA dehydratase, alpha subunit n=1 Tax=Candidatus Magnetoglobus multicellularis str. Araruama TaxID=890399 RepID=A0A1V1PDX4_9BACT|nr:MAG: 2-hydroxyglutaryl-CoA dehydratase, alpha subunit [Candidatus Magnetoglobus multicellularis str. Araruama]
MKYAGIDIGSRTIELVIIESGKILEQYQTNTGYDPVQAASQLLNGLHYDFIMATGYGREIFQLAYESHTVTEIKAYARGVKEIFPNAKTILDIGGQDSKAISLLNNGKIKKFEMNDRCAAGTGKFLEVMANALGFPMDQFGDEALKATKDLKINSMCTVFAESEVTSLIAKGNNRYEIARGLHASVVRRAVSMLKRISISDEIVFAGGVAKNACIRHLLADALEHEIKVPDAPQFIGAIGAALLAGD